VPFFKTAEELLRTQICDFSWPIAKLKPTSTANPVSGLTLPTQAAVDSFPSSFTGLFFADFRPSGSKLPQKNEYIPPAVADPDKTASGRAVPMQPETVKSATKRIHLKQMRAERPDDGK
jgi:hypothetical protein